MQRNIRFVLAYDGTEFHGWQRQPGQRTVQDSLEQAARRVARHQVLINGAGRTDAGVHAQGQVANFETTSSIPCDKLGKAMGSRLPKDISIRHVREVPLTFRSSRDAVSKLYRYRIHNHAQRPVEELTHRYVYHFWHPLDLSRMQAAARLMVGEKDFIAFASSGSARETTVRTVLGVQVYRHLQEIRVDVEGTGFLYNQVRNMVGTLIEIGRGHWAPEYVSEILASRDRSLAGPTAPARGLCMQWVRYDLPTLFAAASSASAAQAEAAVRQDDLNSTSADLADPSGHPEPSP
jgi:tRNA pseudouridine38-40 synthase